MGCAQVLGEQGRLPHGRRGLKFGIVPINNRSVLSPSSRKAGIEIDFLVKINPYQNRSPSSRKAGIEIALTLTST